MVINFEEHARNTGTLKKIKKETSWVKHLIYFGIGIMTLGMISVIIGIRYYMKESFYAYPFFVSLSIWIYWVGYVAIRRSYSHSKVKKLNDTSVIPKKGFSTFNKINDYIVLQNIYLQSDLNRDVIAKEFGISNGYLSQIVNNYTENNFNDYINKLRVESSKEKLLDKQYNNYTIELIGLECGFKSKSNFYTAFKRHTGLTPNQFKRENLF